MNKHNTSYEPRNFNEVEDRDWADLQNHKKVAEDRYKERKARKKNKKYERDENEDERDERDEW